MIEMDLLSYPDEILGEIMSWFRGPHEYFGLIISCKRFWYYWLAWRWKLGIPKHYKLPKYDCFHAMLSGDNKNCVIYYGKTPIAFLRIEEFGRQFYHGDIETIFDYIGQIIETMYVFNDNFVYWRIDYNKRIDSLFYYKIVDKTPVFNENPIGSCGYRKAKIIKTSSLCPELKFWMIYAINGMLEDKSPSCPILKLLKNKKYKSFSHVAIDIDPFKGLSIRQW